VNKIIFLDFDGVLNSIDQSLAQQSLERQPMYRLYTVDDVRVGILKWIVDMTDAKIVISSTWRMGNSIDWFKGFFEALNWVNCPVIGKTPQLKGTSFRGDEVNAWMEDRMDTDDKYVILDDDSDFYKNQSFIHIDRICGLTLKHAVMCVDVLGLADEANRKTIESFRETAQFRRNTNLGDVKL
jgi:hypothetical protein